MRTVVFLSRGQNTPEWKTKQTMRRGGCTGIGRPLRDDAPLLSIFPLIKRLPTHGGPTETIFEPWRQNGGGTCYVFTPPPPTRGVRFLCCYKFTIKLYTNYIVGQMSNEYLLTKRPWTFVYSDNNLECILFFIILLILNYCYFDFCFLMATNLPISYWS